MRGTFAVGALLTDISFSFAKKKKRVGASKEDCNVDSDKGFRVENGLGWCQAFKRRKTVWGCQRSYTLQTVVRRLSTMTDTRV